MGKLKATVVIKNLNEPAQRVVIGQENTLRDAETMQKRFMALRWEQRRPYTYSISNIILTVEVAGERPRFIVLLGDSDGEELMEAVDGTTVFDDKERALELARGMMSGMQPGAVWATLYQLTLLETVRPI